MADEIAKALLAAELASLPIPGTFTPQQPNISFGERMRGFSHAISGDIQDSANSVASALMAPGNALRGEYNDVEIMPDGSVAPFSGPLMEAAANMAGVVNLGSMPIPRPSNSLGMGMAFKSADEIEKFAKDNGVSLYLSESPSKITVSKIVVPASERNKGMGTQVMQMVSEYADANGKPITLTPSTDFGGKSVKTLENFYKRFGFASNTGRNKDYTFTDTMVRYPSGK
jgi:predicted GNAT family acetyltransferase